MESLLMFLNEIEKHTTLLVPTYSFFRIYKAGHVLPVRIDLHVKYL